MLRNYRALALIVALPIVGLSVACPGNTVDTDAGTQSPGITPPEPTPQPASPEPEPVDAGVDAGVDPGFDGGTSPIVVAAITPPEGPLFGGDRVRVDGDFFTPESRVFFGDYEADQVLFLNSTTVTARVPQGDEPGPTRVCIENELGRGCLDGGYNYFSPVTIEAIDPVLGSVDGGDAVTLTGTGFSADMIVLIGGRQAVGLVVAEDRTTATLMTPPADVAGRADVEGIDTFGRSVLPLAFTYTSELALTGAAPRVIDEGTTPVIELSGTGFDDDTAVEIGGTPAFVQNLINSSRLRVTAPAGLTGSNDIVAIRGAETAVLVDALFVNAAPLGALAVVWASPTTGDVLGGTLVDLAGEGFSDVTSVTVGGTEAASFTVLSDRSIQIETPAGVGAADIVVTTGTASATFTGFSYVVPLDIGSIDPATGPVEGGTPVTLTGRNFAADATVSIGGIPMLDVVFVNETTITATTSAGTSGRADITVTSGGEATTLEDGFLFSTDLAILSVRPARGGISGNTFVTISGAGFSRGKPAVTFDQLPAASVTVVSDNLLFARTPFNAPGVVNVTVSRVAETDVAEDAFTYFNPANVVGGTRGGQVNGAVYLTALDSFTGAPIVDGVAFLGTQGGGISALTNIIGQATLSGPEVIGPQTVSVVAEGYEYATVVDVNAAEVTVFLQPLNLVPPPPGDAEPPPPPIPPTIRGRVFGFAKEFFDPAALSPDEIAVALVVTTARDEFSGTPNPGAANAVFAEGGEYFIAQARTGRLAVVALAGIFNLDTGEFRMRQMGVRRNVATAFGVDLVEQDIELTISLDQNIELSLPDAPVQVNEGGPTITRVLPFLQFGGEGSLAYTDAVQTSRNHPLTTMPDVPGELLTFIAGAYTTDGAGLVTNLGTANLIAGEAVALGTGTNWDLADFFGNSLVEGAIIVVEGPSGEKWASTISRSLGAGEILLNNRPPFSVTGGTYHIGNPTYPSSEVVQDGVGDLIGGVTIQPVLGIPEPTSPLPNGVLQDRTLRWKAAPGQQPTVHLMYVYDPIEFGHLWTFYVDGSRTKVPVPRFPDNIDELGLDLNPTDIRPWGYAWQHTAIYTPGLDFENFSYIDIGTRSRRAWTTNVNFFTFGGN